MFYTALTAVPELALEPDDDIVIVTPRNQETDENPNKSARESVDDVDLDEEDDEHMPQLIPQANDGNDSASSDEEDEDEASESGKGPVTGRTASGQAVRAPIRYRDQEIGAMLANIERMDINDAYVQAEIAGAAVSARAWELVLSPARNKYLKAMDDIDGTDFGDEDANEYAAVGAGLGGWFTNTAELRPMKYNEALHGPDQKKWETAVDEEHNIMLKFGVWEAVRRRDLKTASKIITSTWAMKKKASGTYRARLNARGFKQREGQHYDGTSISAPVSNEMVIRIVLVLMIMAGWVGEILDVQGAFLHGDSIKAKKFIWRSRKDSRNTMIQCIMCFYY
jgi:hypothetical protein